MNYQRGAAHLLLLVLLLIGVAVGVYLVQTQTNFFSRAAAEPIVFKSREGKLLPIENNIAKTTSPKVIVELTSPLGPPVSVSGPVSGPAGTRTVSYRVGVDPTQLNNAPFLPYRSSPTVLSVQIKSIFTPQFYWAEFKDTSGKTTVRSTQIQLITAPAVKSCATNCVYAVNQGNNPALSPSLSTVYVSSSDCSTAASICSKAGQYGQQYVNWTEKADGTGRSGRFELFSTGVTGRPKITIAQNLISTPTPIANKSCALNCVYAVNLGNDPMSSPSLGQVFVGSTDCNIAAGICAKTGMYGQQYVNWTEKADGTGRSGRFELFSTGVTGRPKVNIYQKTTPAWCTIAIADIDKDGTVTAADIQKVAYCSGVKQGDFKWTECKIRDLNSDGVVNQIDIDCVASFWGQKTTPTPVAAKRVFVTSTTYNGNLGGLAGADAKCQERANVANLGGSWKAWLTDTTNSPQTTFKRSNNPYKRLDGVTVANNWADLTDGSLQNGINITELGKSYNNTLWASASYYGGPGGSHCKSWTSASSADTGTAATAGVIDSSWASYATKQCTSSLPLFCFEQ